MEFKEGRAVEKAVEVLGLTKRFGELTAVDHISFDIKRGEIFGLLGPNGAGKTTTIHMLATILRPSEGTALVAGHDIRREPKMVRRKIGIVFQDMTLDRNLTGYENMWVYGRLYGLSGSRLRARIAELLRTFGLSEWGDVLVKKYSGGMMRRLEIARSLLNQPEILFLDEPTLGLDPHTRRRIWDYIRYVNRELGVTVLMTTHYLEEADALCDRIAIIDRGRIIAMGSPSELKRLVSGDVLRVRVRGNPAAIGELARRLSAEMGARAEVLGNEIVLTVPEASTAIPTVFRVADGIGLTVLSMEYRKPSLDDVFIKLTGRSMREAPGSWLDFMKFRRTVRLRRR